MISILQVGVLWFPLIIVDNVTAASFDSFNSLLLGETVISSIIRGYLLLVCAEYGGSMVRLR